MAQSRRHPQLPWARAPGSRHAAAIQLSPLDPARFAFEAFLAEGLLTARRYAEAVEAARSARRLNRLHVTPHRVLGIALAMQDRLDEARSVAVELLQRDPAFTVTGYERRYPGRDFPHLAERLHALRLMGLPD